MNKPFYKISFGIEGFNVIEYYLSEDGNILAEQLIFTNKLISECYYFIKAKQEGLI